MREREESRITSVPRHSPLRVLLSDIAFLSLLNKDIELRKDSVTCPESSCSYFVQARF